MLGDVLLAMLAQSGKRSDRADALVQAVEMKRVSWAASITGARPTIAAIGKTLAIALANTAMSGSTP